MPGNVCMSHCSKVEVRFQLQQSWRCHFWGDISGISLGKNLSGGVPSRIPNAQKPKKTCKRFKCFTEKYRKHKGWFRNPGFTHLPCVKPYGKLAKLPTGFLPSTRECLKKTNPAEASILACWKSFETSDSWIWLKSIFSTSKLLHQNHTSLPTLESLFCHFESICLKPLINSIWVITFMDKFKKKHSQPPSPNFHPIWCPQTRRKNQQSSRIHDLHLGVAIINASQDLKLGVAVTTVDGRNRALMSETL